MGSCHRLDHLPNTNIVRTRCSLQVGSHHRKDVEVTLRPILGQREGSREGKERNDTSSRCPSRCLGVVESLWSGGRVQKSDVLLLPQNGHAVGFGLAERDVAPVEVASQSEYCCLVVFHRGEGGRGFGLVEKGEKGKSRFLENKDIAVEVVRISCVCSHRVCVSSSDSCCFVCVMWPVYSAASTLNEVIVISFPSIAAIVPMFRRCSSSDERVKCLSLNLNDRQHRPHVDSVYEWLAGGDFSACGSET